MIDCVWLDFVTRERGVAGVTIFMLVFEYHPEGIFIFSPCYRLNKRAPPKNTCSSASFFSSFIPLKMNNHFGII